MQFIRRGNGVLSIGHRVWMFTKLRIDDDHVHYSEDPPTVYRQFVLHAFRLHIVLEWEMR